MSRKVLSRVMDLVDRETELALVQGLRCGDTTAFDAVYDAFRPRLFGFLLRLSRRRTLAEDLLDEVWLRLVSNASSLRPDTRLGPWLFTVARNLYWSHCRSCEVEERYDTALLGFWPSPETWPSPFDLAVAGQLERRVERALADLLPQQREVLLLIAREGLTPSEAADVCGVTPEALRQRLSRARAALAGRLDPAGLIAPAKRSYAT